MLHLPKLQLLYLKRGTLYSGQKEAVGKPGQSISQLRTLRSPLPHSSCDGPVMGTFINTLAPSTSAPRIGAKACRLYNAQGHLPSLVTKGGTSPCPSDTWNVLIFPPLGSLWFFMGHVTVLFSDLCSVVPGLLLHLQKPRGFYLRGQWAAENPAGNSTQSPHSSADPGVHCRGEPSSFSLSGWISLPMLL